MATLLRKIGLIRLHNRDTEDPKHHHPRRGSLQRGKSNHKNKQQLQATPASGCGSPSRESCSSSRGGSPARNKPKKVLELAKQQQQHQPAAAHDAGKEKAQPLGGGKEASSGKEQPSGGGSGVNRSGSALVSAALVPATRQAHCTQVRTRRLMKELQDIARLSDRFISVELVDESLFDWNVKLHQVDKDSVLWQDMKETNTEYILLNLTFPDNFPFAPPFMRVLSPRLENGYVLDGGAICMELLTPRGWSSAYTVEAVMRQFAASLVKGQGRICRKSGKSKKSFSRKEAEATFKSLVKTHEKYGWVTPPVSDG
ncbi:ubiquitin-conjugating enzyme E2Q-like protein 1 [Erythrolamprus reginae]|uniref:ubiquitin-conjugating enzyme E2Q-like protein 1 n=1 Tax=Erythrolamprus reginae TaxID=121349 RepID=UPI00396C5D5E